ncbi:putative Amino acid transporter [Spironucleus salmonicida]|uniref:Amino acid transporter n=1 Tax=Spironucleus salmonicida TaxID=348837 RepID=V6M2A2_9EUKA|nr:putative Amino acid transporter [Spironucleus salmonicida]|eukprot:EST47354.1 Amino acid transporter family protein [Spironucleus salmonicida]
MRTYKAYTVSALLINFAMGTGVLNLPKTVANASILVSFAILTLVTFQAYLLARYTLDSLARTFAIQRTTSEQQQQIPHLGSTENIMISYENTHGFIAEKPDYQIPNNFTFQFSELCHIYWGKTGFIIYQVTIIFFLFGAIWGYASVVAQSISSVVPFGANWECADPCGDSYSEICNVAYYIWTYAALVYCCIMVFFDLSNQNILQGIFTIFRLVSVGGIALITFISIFIGPFNPDGSNVSNEVKQVYIQDTPIFQFSTQSFGSIFSSSAYAIILHSCIPNVVQPTMIDQQKYLNHSITGAFLIMYVIMGFVSYPGGLYFGNLGNQLITLNLIKWDGKSWNATSQPIWAAILSNIIRILPPIYVLGAIPINGITMADNVVAMFPTLKSKKYFIISIKLLCVIPPIIFGGFFRCISDIINITGLFGFVVLLAPAFILIKAKKNTKEAFGLVATPYSGFCDQDWIIILIMMFNIIGFGFAFYTVIVNFKGTS